jgi:photosystem II stability/assembly factor-like uncharacterized protein
LFAVLSIFTFAIPTHKNEMKLLPVKNKKQLKFTFLLISSILFFQPVFAQWSIKNLNENSFVDGSVKFANDSVGLFMGNNSTILKTRDIGETWIKKDLKISINIQDFRFVNDSTVLAVGYSGNSANLTSILIKSENQGETWDSISGFPGKQLQSLWFFNSDSGMVAGYDEIYLTTDSGTSWDTAWSITGFGYQYGELRNLSFGSTEVGYATGIGRNQHNSPSFDNFILKSTDSGVTWELIKTFSGESLASIGFINADTGFVGTNGLIYKTNDGGSNWTGIRLSDSWNTVESIQFISEMKGFATGGAMNYLTSGAGGHFFISATSDGGETWAVFDTTGIPLHSVYFIDDTTGFVSGDHELIMKTEDGISGLPDNYPWHLVGSMKTDEKQLTGSGIKIYPNPTNGILYIENDNPAEEIKMVSIINSSGQTIDAGNPIKYTEPVHFDLSWFQPGLYFIRIEYSGRISFMKVIKN